MSTEAVASINVLAVRHVARSAHRELEQEFVKFFAAIKKENKSFF